MDRKILHNLVSAVALLGLVVMVHFFTRSVDSESSIFPRMVSWVLAGLSFGMIGQSFREYQLEKKKSSRIRHQSNAVIRVHQRVYPFIVVVFCVLFLISFKVIGFELSAVLLMFMIMLLLDWKKGLRKFYFALAVPVVFILIFRVGLKLRIPLFLDRFF